jgi:hypothetical protein
VVRTASGMSNSRKKALLFKSVAAMAICLMVGFTSLLAGCTGLHSSAKQVPDTRPAKEGQNVEVRNGLNLLRPFFVLWEIGSLLSRLMPSSEERDKAVEQEKAKLMEELRRQRQDEAGGKKPR